MNALILNFSSFESKDKSKLYLKFDLYNPAEKAVYPIFADAAFVKLPDGGIIPNSEEFPRIADVDFRMRQFFGKDNTVQYRPDVKEVFKWQKADIKFDFKK